MATFLAVGSTLVVGLLLWALLWGLDRKRHAVAIRLNDYSTEKRHPTVDRSPKEQRRGGLRSVITKWAPKRLSQRYTPIFQQAGIPLKGEEMAVFIGVSTLLGVLLGGLMLSIPGHIIGGIVGNQVPGQVLKNYLRRRLRAAEEQLVDFLTLSANAMRAGNSLLQALDLAGREMPDPIGTELKRTLREINLGLSVDDALQRFVVRIPSADLDLVLTAVIIQRQVGGDLAGILDNIASTIRQRQQMKAQVRTLTAQGRLSGMVIAGLPFALLLILRATNPDYVSLLWTEPLGLLLLGAGLVSQIFGMVFINKIIQVEI
ncbi:MAG: tight adherence protein B [Bacillota bacterium]|nr:MAG: tight adherence protein B [Bacillota bacterium]MBS3949268.1 type II secretion system F family protein [Peptococcaceae bacterium]